jgi:RimJ/RimL family protein N-acetyltransferase
LFDGRAVRVGWPDASEYDRITDLRNRDGVRGRFLDDRPLDLAANRRWLATGMQRPREALLSIRLAANGTWVGAIGWSAYDPAQGTMEFGRMMVDLDALLPHRPLLPERYEGVAADASAALRDFVFGRMGIAKLTFTIQRDNALSLRTARLGGARRVGTRMLERPDGTMLDLVALEMTRDDWLALPAAARVRA